MKLPKYWGYSEAAQELNINKNTLYAKVCRKEIPHIRLGRRHVLFPREEVITWLEQHRVMVEVDNKTKKG